MDEKVTKYEQWVDVFKGILIIFVIIGHGYYHKLNDIIFWFHMPLFFWASEYLFKIPEKTNLMEWCKKQIKSLLIPCLFFYVVSILLSVNQLSLVNIVKKAAFFIFIYGGRMLPGVYWFITCLLLSRIIMVFIESYIDNERKKVLYM